MYNVNYRSFLSFLPLSIPFSPLHGKPGDSVPRLVRKGYVVRAHCRRSRMQRFLFALTLSTLFFNCLPANAADKEKKDPVDEVTVRIWSVRGSRCVEIPPDVDFEVDGQYLSWIESDETSTRIFLKGNSIEVYARTEKAAGPKRIKITRFQVGPGFYMPYGWHVSTLPPPRAQ